MAELLSVIAFAAFAFFCARRLLRYLHIFQQDEYDASRFLPWLANTASFDKRVSAALVLFGIMTYITKDVALGLAETGLIAALFAVAGLREADPRKAAKKKLVLTHRAKRIFALSFGLCLLVGLGAAIMGGSFKWLAAVQLIPFLLVVGNFLLKPVETNIQNGFRTAAEARLRQVAPKTIGITGSFGKTSVKHILGHVLQMNTNALYTPGSVNTVMGISRIINERLADNCKYFIVEMGAYGIGSIKRLCNFTPPDHGILTSIGEAHYERFKDLETVAEAKFELAEAVAQRKGIMVIDETVLDRAYARKFVEADRKSFIVVGDSTASDIQNLSNEQTRDGLVVKIKHGDSNYELFAPLFGIHHGRNMALAYALASSLGIASDRIVAALRSTPQIVHRLEVKSHPSGATYVDDAFNANTDGIINGIDLLAKLQKEGGRRILVTPGVAELGTRHDEVHDMLGAKAARDTEVTIAVKPERIPTFVQGFRNAGTDAELLTLETFNEAQAWINQNLSSNDAILIANDLPDLLEREFPT